MKTLRDGEAGMTYTVRKILGGRKNEARLEQLGIMSGADITLLSAAGDGFRVRAGQRELLLAPEDGEAISITRLFAREGDPILMSSCCSGGNAGGLWDRINEEED